MTGQLHEGDDGRSDGGDKDRMRTVPDRSQRRDTQHKGLTDGRPERAIVQGGLTSSSTNHVVASRAATEEAGNIRTLGEEQKD